jgi:hypothetical protein
MGMFITVNVKTVFWRGNKVKEEKKQKTKQNKRCKEEKDKKIK